MALSSGTYANILAIIKRLLPAGVASVLSYVMLIF